jgi:phage shock protein PspC (stress-responsive transcriptional regulator)
MFRYGGDVKAKGVMHGMKNMQDGGPATMADATGLANGGMPNMRGRVTGPGGYAGEKNMFGMGVAKNADGTPVTIPKRNFQEDMSFILNPFMKLKMAGLAGKAGIAGLKNFYKGPNPARIAGEVKNRIAKIDKPAFLSDKYLGSMVKGPYESTKKIFRDAFGPATGSLKDYKGALAVGVPGTGYGAYKMYQGFKDRQKGINPNDPNDPKNKPGANVPDAVSDIPKPTQAEIEAKTKALEDKKLKRIYKLLGVDSAQRNAASKALADVSRYIDEGGKDTISKKNIGSTLTKGILAFDKRLDKVDQLKEAAGLLLAKGEIAAMSDPLGKEIQKSNLEINKMKIDQAKDASTIYASFRSTQGGGLTADQAAEATAQKLYKDSYNGNIIDADTFEDLVKENSVTGRGEREVIVGVIEGIAEKYDKPNGVYTVKDKIIEIKNKKVNNIIRG